MTHNTNNYAEQASVYPGKYEPLPWKEKELQDEISRKGARIAKPPIQIREMPDYYKMEMHAPGYRAEDFFVHADGRTLTVGALAPRSCLNIKYTLPQDSDIDFATAEYRNGILQLFFFKTAYPAGNKPGRIVVYS